MNDRIPNTARGEVALNIDGETLILSAKMCRVALLMDALKTNDLNEIRSRVFPAFREILNQAKKKASDTADGTEQPSMKEDMFVFDLKSTFLAVKFLCVSHDGSSISEMLHIAHLLQAGEAVMKCLNHVFEDGPVASDTRQEVGNGQKALA